MSLTQKQLFNCKSLSEFPNMLHQEEFIFYLVVMATMVIRISGFYIDIVTIVILVPRKHFVIFVTF